MVGAAELDMAFASGALSAWADTSMTAPEEVCDRMFEGARHAIIDFEAALSPRDRGLLRPLLDLLTGLKLSESKPVATAVLGPGMHGVFSAIEWGQANPTELEIIKTALPRLQALARPLGPFDLAVVRLIELTVECQVLPTCVQHFGVFMQLTSLVQVVKLAQHHGSRAVGETSGHWPPGLSSSPLRAWRPGSAGHHGQRSGLAG